MMRIVKIALGKPNSAVGLVLVSVLLFATMLGLVYTPHDPIAINLENRLAAPSFVHWFGTDQFGRDILSRMLTAARVSISVSFMTVAIAVSLGVFLGAFVGYWGGRMDRAVMMCVDALMAIPAVLLALTIMIVLGPNIFSMVVALGISYLPNIVRLVRGVVFSLRSKEYIEAAHALGKSDLYIIFRHIIPNCISPLTVAATSLFAFALLAESALSFLGLGVPPPFPTWGGMLSEGRQYIGVAPWLSVFPGLAISLALLGINLLGDALRDALDPRMNQIR